MGQTEPRRSQFDAALTRVHLATSCEARTLYLVGSYYKVIMFLSHQQESRLQVSRFPLTNENSGIHLGNYTYNVDSESPKYLLLKYQIFNRFIKVNC